MKLRNKILAMAVVAVAGTNVYLANDIRVQRNELSLLNLENIAEADETNAGNEYNSFWQWFTQGLTMDEVEERRVCPSYTSSSGSGSASVSNGVAGGSVSGSGSHTQTNPSTRYEIICPYGYSNCTEVGC